jgi:signal transduction histidine kinase
MRSISLKATVRAATIVAIAGCAVIVAAVGSAFYLLERAESRVVFANALISDAGRLNLLTAELMLHQSSRATLQWSLLQEALIRDIDNAPTLQDGAGALMQELTDRLRYVKALIMRKDGSAKPGGNRQPLTGEALDILRSAIISHSHAVLERAGELHEMLNATATATRRNVLLMLGAGLLLFLIGGGAALLLLSKDMLGHILRLRGTIQKLGRGELDAEIPADAPNEMGDVFAELDRMRCSLLKSMEELGRANIELIATHSKLEERTVSLESANRELEAFTSAVSHDLRAPLRTIMGFSEALLEDFGPQLDKEGRDMLGRIGRAGRQMLTLIDDLLRLSKLGREKLHIEPVDLSALASELCRTIGERHPDHPVTATIAPNLKADCDRQLIGIAPTNLLENAWKFTNGTADPKIEVGCEVVDGVTQYFVQDNGAGFDMNFRENLFKPFKRLHTAAEFPGTGIGLATVARIIHRHGGTIWANAAPGEGARFTFRLGKAGGAAHTESEARQTAADSPKPMPLQRAAPRRAGGRL